MNGFQVEGNCSLSISWVGAYNGGNGFDDPMQVELVDRLRLNSNKPALLGASSIVMIIASVVLVIGITLAIAMAANKFYVSCTW